MYPARVTPDLADSGVAWRGVFAPRARPRTTFVRFDVLGPLVSVGWRPERRAEATPAALIAAIHLCAVLALRLAVIPSGGDPVLAETVTYMDVAPPPSAESPRAALQRARPLVVAQSVIIPGTGDGSVTRPDQVAGFQELLAPKEATGQLPGDGGGVEVKEQDFSGRGIAGGVAGGKPPNVLPDSLAAALAREGAAADYLAAAARRPAVVLDEDEVLVKPELTNREAFGRLLMDRYPPLMAQAGIDGRVILEFIVDTTGQVRAGSTRVIQSTNQMFADAALSVLSQARFAPGRTERGNRRATVPVRVRLPLTWVLRY